MKALTPTTPNELSPADEAAHLAASYVRTAPGDSDPDPDEALRRARGLASAGSIR